MNSHKICRICLVSPEGMNSLSELLPSSAQQISLIFGVQIELFSHHSHIPTLICSQCLLDLSKCIEFREKVLRADEHFLQNIEPEVSVEQHIVEPEVSIKVEKPEVMKIKSEPDDDPNYELPVENPYFNQYSESFYSQNEDPVGVGDGRLPFYEDESVENAPKKSRAAKRKTEKDPATTSTERAFCSMCMKSYKTLKYLRVHEKLVHATEKFVCDFCGYRCKTKRSIKYHVIDSHSSTPKDKFICRTCGVAVASKGNLFNHEKTHIEVDPKDYVVCNFCQKSFKEMRLLQNHVQIVHQKLKAVSCPIPECQHVSTCQGSLNKHIRTVHQKIRNFKCSECPAAFYQRSELQRHFRTHTGERPFPCDFEGCVRTYPSNKGKKQHMAVCPLRPVTTATTPRPQ